MGARAMRDRVRPVLVLGVGMLLAVLVVVGATRGLGQSTGSGSRGETRRIPPSTLEPTLTTQPVAPVAPKEPENLLPELARLVDREGTVARQPVGAQGGERMVFRSTDERLELVLLENRYLETLESVTEDGKKAAKLLVSGTVYVYRGRNYLLLTRVQIKQP